MSNCKIIYPTLELENEDINVALDALREFNSKNQENFAFGENDVRERQKFVFGLLNILKSVFDKSSSEITTELISALVVMSRDRSSVIGRFSSVETCKMISTLAGFYGGSNELNETSVIQASKCLCNVIYLSKDQENFCSDENFLQNLVRQLKSRLSVNSNEIEFLTLRLTFLVTALNIQARGKLVEQFETRRILIDSLTQKIQSSKRKENPTPFLRCHLEEALGKSCSEILKILFNLNVKTHSRIEKVTEEELVTEFFDISSLCRKCLLLEINDNPQLTTTLHSDTCNCLYSVPLTCFADREFIPEISKDNEQQEEDDETMKEEIFGFTDLDVSLYEGRDMSAISNIIDMVETKMQKNQLSTESLQPILSLLSQLSRTSRYIRKYCKDRIIPPRKDFDHRPEEGPEFCNRLIKLFTNANTDVKMAAADFVFVMCKEKVDRLVKYTGYGNAAGLLADRGLLGGGRGDTIYSDTDSESDTEEYLDNIDRINLITGNIPPEMPNPMEGMSEEQKEYLAMELANQISKLSTDSVIQPACLDEETGKLVSFQEKVAKTVLKEEKDSDDNDDE